MPTRIAWALLGLLIAGCSDNDVGSPTPPEGFGKVDAALAGCPRIDGTYAWPPKQGVLDGYQADGAPRRDRYATPQFFGLTFSGASQFRVTSDGKQVSFAILNAPSRIPSHSERVRGVRSMASEAAVPHKCSGAWIVIEPIDHPSPAARDNYGGPAKIGARMAPLEGGDLLLAQHIRVTDQSGWLFTWGDGHAGSIRLPDKVYWRWARFERVR